MTSKLLPRLFHAGLLTLTIVGCQAKAFVEPNDLYLAVDVSESARNLTDYSKVVEQACHTLIGQKGLTGEVTIYLFADDVELVERSDPQNILEQRQICTNLAHHIETRQVGMNRGTSFQKALTAIGNDLKPTHSHTITILLDRNESSTSADTEQMVSTLETLLPQTKTLTLIIADNRLQQQLSNQIKHAAFKTCPFKAQSGC